MLYTIPRRKGRRKIALARPATANHRSLPIPTAQESNTHNLGYESQRTTTGNLNRDIVFDKMPPTQLPIWLTSASLPEELDTESSELQQETAEECLPLLTRKGFGLSAVGLPQLDREKHVRFLRQFLGRLPAGFSGLDASRPWILYWCLNGLAVLEENVSAYRQELVSTLAPIQNITGGFGGGHGQYSHLATTYAAVLSLAAVGGEKALNLIDRRAMWYWLGSLKQPDGDFSVCMNGERDVRGAYCAMVMLSLLNLPLELPPTSPARIDGKQTFITGLPEWISRCQTYEGGISCSPGAEAHGAYTFCALACLCILGEPHIVLNKYLNLSALVAWLSARQHAPEGGLAGRTNKLVDGCYSHWIGGCWSLVEAALEPTLFRGESQISRSLWNPDGLIRYILCCCQADKGGLRDKPSKNPDAYHTNYNLVGLSSAQNQFRYERSANLNMNVLEAPFRWKCSKASRHKDQTHHRQIFDESDRVAAIHPVFVIPTSAVEEACLYFHSRPLDKPA